MYTANSEDLPIFPNKKNNMKNLKCNDVQNEPVTFCEDAALSIAERTFSTEVDEQLANDIIQYAQRLHSLYTAPQPTEQVERWRHDAEDLEALHHNLDDAGTPRHDSSGNEYSAWGRVIQYAKAATTQPSEQPAPDTALVEALEACSKELMFMIEKHNVQSDSDGSWLYDHQTVYEADQALAAYHKGDDS